MKGRPVRLIQHHKQSVDTPRVRNTCIIMKTCPYIIQRFFQLKKLKIKIGKKLIFFLFLLKT